jgi:hypothetical protein
MSDSVVEKDYPLPDDEQPAAMRNFIAIARKICTLVVALAIINLVMSLMAFGRAGIPSCIGKKLIAGYHIGLFDMLDLPFVAAITVWMARKMAQGRDRRFRDLFNSYTAPTRLFFGLVQGPFGAVVAYATMLGVLAIAGVLMGASITRFSAIVAQCPRP